MRLGALGAAPVLVLVLVAACGAFGSANTGGEPVASGADAAFDGEGTDGAAARPEGDGGSSADADAGSAPSTDASVGAKDGSATTGSVLCAPVDFSCPVGRYCCKPTGNTAPICEVTCAKTLCAPAGDPSANPRCPLNKPCLLDGTCQP